MGTKFLTGKRLAKRIRKVMAADSPRMCVAFLGPSWAKELFENGDLPTDLRIICDLRMRMTVRPALRMGGAPSNDCLRHLPDQEMHAKVYLSEEGAVICSANASRAALRPDDRVEDGVWLPPKSKAYSKAASTFKKRYRKAVQVDAGALAKAPEHLTGLGATAVGRDLLNDFDGPPTLLQLLRHDPDAFRGIRFIFSNENVPRAVRDNARALMEADDEAYGVVKESGDARRTDYDYFSDWDRIEENWPALFISVHRRPNGSILLGMRRHLRFISGVPDGKAGEEDVFVAAKVRWNIGGAAFGDLHRLGTIKKCEAELQRCFADEISFTDVAGRVLCAMDARELLARP